jgi:hypothetical protein
VPRRSRCTSTTRSSPITTSRRGPGCEGWPAIPAVSGALLRRLVDEHFQEVGSCLRYRRYWSDEQFGARVGHPDPMYGFVWQRRCRSDPSSEPGWSRTVIQGAEGADRRTQTDINAHHLVADDERAVAI